jgi:hypothetical protein
MTATVLHFRPATGTTPGDLADVRRVLAGASGWAAEIVPGDAPWIAATGPEGAAWAILRQSGRFVAAPDDGERPGFAGMITAADAARVVLQAARGA